MDFGNRIALIIETLNTNQAAFAKLLGISTGVVSEFVNGVRKPSKGFLFGLSELGISLDWFITGEGRMFRVPHTVGDRLKEARLECNLDMETVSNLLEISFTEYQSYEKNETEPSAAILEKLEKIFNINSVYIRNGHGNMFTNIPGGALINGKLVLNPETPTEYKRQYKIPHITRTENSSYAEIADVDKSLMDEIYDLKKRIEQLEKTNS